VFVDESGAKTDLTRSHGRAPPGERVVDRVPQDTWKVMTMLGALSLQGMIAGATVEAATDQAIFQSFVREALLPQLHAGDVVIWDNLPAHRIPALKKLLRQAGARLLPLPPYSPDLSPMEPAWSKVKQYLRSVKPRTGEALRRAAAKAFTTITAKDAKGWFRLCGYRVR
jgi:transposase